MGFAWRAHRRPAQIGLGRGLQVLLAAFLAACFALRACDQRWGPQHLLVFEAGCASAEWLGVLRAPHRQILFGARPP